METRNEKWQSLRLEAQKFSPQEFVAGCEESVIYEWTSMGGSGAGVVDAPVGAGDKIFGDYESQNGHIKNINPHASTLTFTEAARNKIMTAIDAGQAWGWASPEKQSMVSNHTLCFLIEVNESQANSGNPLDAQHVTIPMETAGHGAYAFDITSKPVKNHS